MISEELKSELRKELKKRSPYFLAMLKAKMGKENRDSQIRKQYYDNIDFNTRLRNPGKP